MQVICSATYLTGRETECVYGSSGSGCELVAGFCKKGHEPRGLTIARKFLTICVNGSFSRRTLFHGVGPGFANTCGFQHVPKRKMEGILVRCSLRVWESCRRERWSNSTPLPIPLLRVCFLFFLSESFIFVQQGSLLLMTSVILISAFIYYLHPSYYHAYGGTTVRVWIVIGFIDHLEAVTIITTLSL